MSKKKIELPFDRKGGTIAINRRLINSKAFLTMSPAVSKLLILLHSQWRPDRPVGYGVREAAKKIGCAHNTAAKAFQELEKRGFIIREEESFFNSRNGSRAREWRLTWMPYTWGGYAKPPSNEWEKWKDKKS
jgi:hypothetical protein